MFLQPRLFAAGFVTIVLLNAIGRPSSADDAKEPPVVWKVTEGCARPESAYFDTKSGFLFVSQMSGEAAAKDGVGWISKLDWSGKVVTAKWVEGLNAPKGLRSMDDTLWVSDIDELVGISISTGKVTSKIKIEGAKFLNDVATAEDGSVYVSDMLGNRIYVVRTGKVSVFAEGPELEFPNGLLVDGNNLIVGARGEITDMKSTKPGHLYSLDLKTAKQTLITNYPLGVLDGVESDGNGGYIVSDWLNGCVFQVTKTSQPKLLIQLTRGTADLAYFPKEKLLILPRMLDDNVTAYDLSKLLPGS
jgi:outer membrane protein assembly factor BamB